jgi:hypothetical protein
MTPRALLFAAVVALGAAGCGGAPARRSGAERPIVITRTEELSGAVGRVVTLRGVVANTKIPTLVGVDIDSETPDLRGRPATATGVLERWTVTQEELDRRAVELGGQVASRSAGTIYRLVEAGTRRLVQVSRDR